MDDGLGQDDPRLRHPDLGHRVQRGDRGLERGGVGHPDILGGGDDHPPGDEPRVLPASSIRAR